MLVEVDPVEVTEISRVGLLGWVDALAMKDSQRKLKTRESKIPLLKTSSGLVLIGRAV